MGLSVLFLSGPRRSGKSAVARAMIDLLFKKEPHYIRLVRSGSDKRRPTTRSKPARSCGVASTRWIEYEADRVFEILPKALTAIHRKDRYGSVVLEADTNIELRHAYPYDQRVFIMPTPASLEVVFRDPHRAAVEFQRVLDDTDTFAATLLGLANPQLEDSDLSPDRAPLADSQMRAFLYSPLGDELATRIQLQPPYHGLVESDLVIINTGVGRRSEGTGECIRRIERLIERTSGAWRLQTPLLLCNPCDPKAGGFKRLLKALRPMCQGGR